MGCGWLGESILTLHPELVLNTANMQAVVCAIRLSKVHKKAPEKGSEKCISIGAIFESIQKRINFKAKYKAA